MAIKVIASKYWERLLPPSYDGFSAVSINQLRDITMFTIERDSVLFWPEHRTHPSDQIEFMKELSKYSDLPNHIYVVTYSPVIINCVKFHQVLGMIHGIPGKLSSYFLASDMRGILQPGEFWSCVNDF